MRFGFDLVLTLLLILLGTLLLGSEHDVLLLGGGLLGGGLLGGGLLRGADPRLTSQWGFGSSCRGGACGIHFFVSERGPTSPPQSAWGKNLPLIRSAPSILEFVIGVCFLCSRWWNYIGNFFCFDNLHWFLLVTRWSLSYRHSIWWSLIIILMVESQAGREIIRAELLPLIRDVIEEFSDWPQKAYPYA